MGGVNFKYVIILIISSVLFWGCGASSQLSSARYSYKILEKKRISETRTTNLDGSLSLNYEIMEGEKLVFEYSHVPAQDMQIEGDEVKETVVFEMEGDKDAFFLRDREIESSICYYRRSCQCAGAGVYKINTGKLKGFKKSDKEWEIEMDITAIGEDTFTRNNMQINISASEVFRK